MKFFLQLFPLLLLAKSIHISPLCRPEEFLYDYSTSSQESAKPFYSLRVALEKAGYRVFLYTHNVNFEDTVAILSFNDNPYSGPLRSFPKERRLHFVFESPVVLPEFYSPQLKNIYGKIFVMLDSMIDNKHYFKLHYPQPRLTMLESLPDFESKRLCAMVASNKDFNHPKSLYRERRQVIQFFSRKKIQWEFDLYGPGWEGTYNWKGTIHNKWETLKNYRFCFCYENMQNQLGYITEKIFDCFIAGCVPIYWGASNITDYVPADCFIDRRDFTTNDQLYHFIRHMDKATYDAKLNAIRAYLATPQAHLFSTEHFVNMILDEIARLDK
ncbi:MAG TPA: glycosyltransferase family 10 [Chlamydiales bacterium]|nr:glycosyltransferase family 10 [Chlamydiales bacterium]